LKLTLIQNFIPTKFTFLVHSLGQTGLLHVASQMNGSAGLVQDVCVSIVAFVALSALKTRHLSVAGLAAVFT
jgi:hypothetical protein